MSSGADNVVKSRVFRWSLVSPSPTPGRSGAGDLAGAVAQRSEEFDDLFIGDSKWLMTSRELLALPSPRRRFMIEWGTCVVSSTSFSPLSGRDQRRRSAETRLPGARAARPQRERTQDVPAAAPCTWNLPHTDGFCIWLGGRKKGFTIGPHVRFWFISSASGTKKCLLLWGLSGRDAKPSFSFCPLSIRTEHWEVAVAWPNLVS